MNRTPPKDTLLLTIHTGRGARMPDVCPQQARSGTDLPGAGHEALFVASFTPPPDRRGGCLSPKFVRRQYQNTIESAYGLLPRPPHTPAARFKRLYQK